MGSISITAHTETRKGMIRHWNSQTGNGGSLTHVCLWPNIKKIVEKLKFVYIWTYGDNKIKIGPSDPKLEVKGLWYIRMCARIQTFKEIPQKYFILNIRTAVILCSFYLDLVTRIGLKSSSKEKLAAKPHAIYPRVNVSGGCNCLQSWDPRRFEL